MSQHTVDDYLNHARRRLGVATRREAALLLKQHSDSLPPRPGPTLVQLEPNEPRVRAAHGPAAPGSPEAEDGAPVRLVRLLGFLAAAPAKELSSTRRLMIVPVLTVATVATASLGILWVRLGIIMLNSLGGR